MHKKSCFILLICCLSNFILVSNNLTIVSIADTNNTIFKTFSPNVLLSTSDALYPQHVEPTLAIGLNNELYVGWKNALGPSSAGVDVSFTTSLDGEQNWTKPVSMPSNVSQIGSKSDPWMNVYNNTIYYSYLEFNDSNIRNKFSQVTMARSTDNGSSWITSKASENTYFADKETFLVSENGTIYLAYDNVNSDIGIFEVKLAKSIDGGKSFKELTRIEDLASDPVLGPYLALSENYTLFATWFMINETSQKGDIYYDYSTNGGKSFGKDIDLNPESSYGSAFGIDTPGKSTIPVMKFDSLGRLYILWAEYNRHWEVYLKYSDNYGLNWSPKIPIHDKSNVEQWEPDMAIDTNNTVHVVWYEQSSNQYRPYYRTITFSGVNRSDTIFSDVIPVANKLTSGTFVRPGDYCTIRIDSNGIPNIVWTDGRSGKLDIYYAKASTEPVKTSNDVSGFLVPYIMIVLVIYIQFIRKRNKRTK